MYSEIFRQNPKIAPKKGYSKAVDIWSIGCVTSHLLSGKPLFNANGQDDVGKKLSTECNLDLLDRDPVWQRVGPRAKDFIRQTLVLDENLRLTAKEALNHEWFANRSHADEFDAVYQHAIKDWEPRRKVFRLVEFINSPRPKMTLNSSRFWKPPHSTELGPLPVVKKVLGKPSVMPAILEEPDCPKAGPRGLPEMSRVDYSDIPGPPHSCEDTESEESTPTKLISGTGVMRQKLPLTPTQLIDPAQRTRQDLVSTPDTDSAQHRPPRLTPTQPLQRTHNVQQDLQMHNDNPIPNSVVGVDSCTRNLPNAHGESIVQQQMTQLSLTDQDKSTVTDSCGSTELSNDLDHDMTQCSPSAQQDDAVLNSRNKRQPSFDFDQGMDDSDFLEATTMVEYRQLASKRLRTG